MIERDSLPKLTITVTAAERGARCGVGGRQHPASEHYDYGPGGGVDRCEKHGGTRMRDSLRGKGREVINRL